MMYQLGFDFQPFLRLSPRGVRFSPDAELRNGGGIEAWQMVVGSVAPGTPHSTRITKALMALLEAGIVAGCAGSCYICQISGRPTLPKPQAYSILVPQNTSAHGELCKVHRFL